MITARHRLYDDPAPALRERALRGLLRAVAFVWQAVVLALNVPNTGQRVKRTRGKGSYTIYPNPAPKGMPPRKRTGWLQRHVKYEVDRRELKARIGLARGADYGVHLDAGDHPWLFRTAEACKDEAAAIIKAELEAP